MKKHRTHKNVAQKSIQADKRRAIRRFRHEVDRKLTRKLYRITNVILDGHFKGVKTSPLLAANIGKVTAYMRKSRRHPSLLDSLTV